MDQQSPHRQRSDFSISLPAEVRQAGSLVYLILPIFWLLQSMGEEIGWRGYALPRLLSRCSSLQASLILGAVWHLPLFLLRGSVQSQIPLSISPISKPPSAPVASTPADPEIHLVDALIQRAKGDQGSVDPFSIVNAYVALQTKPLLILIGPVKKYPPGPSRPPRWIFSLYQYLQGVVHTLALPNLSNR